MEVERTAACLCCHSNLKFVPESAKLVCIATDSDICDDFRPFPTVSDDFRLFPAISDCSGLNLLFCCFYARSSNCSSGRWIMRTLVYSLSQSPAPARSSDSAWACFQSFGHHCTESLTISHFWVMSAKLFSRNVSPYRSFRSWTNQRPV